MFWGGRESGQRTECAQRTEATFPSYLRTECATDEAADLLHGKVAPSRALEPRGRHPRPRRALRALADGYANSALRALAALRLRSTNTVVINKLRTLTLFAMVRDLLMVTLELAQRPRKRLHSTNTVVINKLRPLTLFAIVRNLLMVTLELVQRPRKRPAHGVRDNHSPMQAPVGRAALGEAAPLTSRPLGRNYA